MSETIRELLTRQGALDRQVTVDLSHVLYKRDPAVYVFQTIFSKLSKEKAVDTTSRWIEKNKLPHIVTYTGADEASAAATMVIENWSYLRKGDRLVNMRTNEAIRVTATPTTSTVAVTRDIGSGTLGTGLLKTNDKLKIVATSQAEGDTNMEGRAILPTENYNYVAESEDYARTTKIAEAVQTVTGQDLRQQSIDDMIDLHKRKLELQLLFDERAQTAVSSIYCRSMRGLTRFISTNTWALTDIAEFTRLAFDDYVRRVNQYTPDRKDRVFICSGLFMGRITGWAMNALSINDQRTKEFGMQILKYRCSNGASIDLVEHPLFDEDQWSMYLGLLLQYDKITLRPLAGKVAELQTNVGMAAYNYWLDKITTWMTLRVVNESHLGKITKA